MFEKVHAYPDWYYGPRAGIADFQGVPHLFECEWEERHGYTDTFLLAPVDSDTLNLALEDWAIWLRWETAFHQERTSTETHPALPEERERQGELEGLLEGRLVMPAEGTCRKAGSFRVRNDPASSGDAAMEVEWTEPVYREEVARRE